MPSFKDIAGNTYGRLVVLECVGLRPERSRNGAYWLCLCECGTKKEILGSSLRAGATRSCGCLHRESLQEISFKLTDGRSKGKYFTHWAGAVQRCTNPKNRAWENYGGRGISVYPEWVADYWAFDSWMEANLGPRPQGMTLDRIDNNGNYEPGNLRWATKKQQQANRRYPPANCVVTAIEAERDLWKQRALDLGWTE